MALLPRLLVFALLLAALATRTCRGFGPFDEVRRMMENIGKKEEERRNLYGDEPEPEYKPDPDDLIKFVNKMQDMAKTGEMPQKPNKNEL